MLHGLYPHLMHTETGVTLKGQQKFLKATQTPIEQNVSGYWEHYLPIQNTRNGGILTTPHQLT